MRTKKIIFLFSVLLLSSCASREDNGKIYIDLKGTEIVLEEEPSFFRLIYASDSLVVTESFSNKDKLASYKKCNGGFVRHDFLKVGNGPHEVKNAVIKCVSDTLHVMSYSPAGISSFILIPLDSIDDDSVWHSIPSASNLMVGPDFTPMGEGNYMILATSVQ